MYVCTYVRHRPSTIIDNETGTIQYPHPMRRGERPCYSLEWGPPARSAAMGRGPACTCTAATWRTVGRGVGAREQRAGKVYVLSGELDGDRIIPCCKASYRTEEKLLLSLSHEGEEGRVNLRTRTRTHLQQSRTSEELTATDSH